VKVATARAVSHAAPVLLIVVACLAYVGLGLTYVHQGETPLASQLLVAAGTVGGVVVLCQLRSTAIGMGLRAVLVRLASVCGVALAVVGFFGANVFARMHDTRVDLTAARQHTLSSRTLACLGRLKEPVQIAALYAGPAPDYVKDLLSEMARNGNGLVETEIIDPMQNIGRAAAFGPRIDGQERRVVVTAPGTAGRPSRREDLNCKEIDLSEERLSAALIKVTAPRRTVYFLSGHQEYDPASDKEGGARKFAQALERQGVTTTRLVLAASGQVPADCQVLVVAGAKQDISRDEKDRIRAYQKRGGSVLFLLESALRLPPGESYEARPGTNPVFPELLADWGITAGDDVAVDLANHVGQDAGCPAISEYPPHDKIVSNLGVTFYIRPRSLTFKSPPGGRVHFAPLVRTMGGDRSWAETDRGLFVHYDRGRDMDGPVTIAAVCLREPDRSPGGAAAAKMIVIGNAGFIANEFADRYSNLDLVVNCVAWLSSVEPLLDSTAVRIQSAKLEVTSKDLRRAQFVMGFVPLLVTAIGVLVWWRRNSGPVTASVP
jgi:ABC-type uncharacterized transport system involved in gliding motility auxiliary subunit